MLVPTNSLKKTNFKKEERVKDDDDDDDDAYSYMPTVGWVSDYNLTGHFCPTSTLLSFPELHLKNTVFMTLAGNGLDIEYELKMPANQSGAHLTCSDPFHKQIYNYSFAATFDQPRIFKKTLKLKNLTSSGEYSCHYKTAKVYWFLRVRGELCWRVEYLQLILMMIFSIRSNFCHKALWDSMGKWGGGGQWLYNLL